MGVFTVAEAYCMWEIGMIGVTAVQPDGEKIFMDLSRDGAERLAQMLLGACRGYDELETFCRERDEYCEHMTDEVSGSCARCEGT